MSELTQRFHDFFALAVDTWMFFFDTIKFVHLIELQEPTRKLESWRVARDAEWRRDKAKKQTYFMRRWRFTEAYLDDVFPAQPPPYNETYLPVDHVVNGVKEYAAQIYHQRKHGETTFQTVAQAGRQQLDADIGQSLADEMVLHAIEDRFGRVHKQGQPFRADAVAIYYLSLTPEKRVVFWPIIRLL
jgi:hypothetical protein